MIRRMLPLIGFCACAALSLILLADAPAPGEKAVGPEFKADKFVLVWGKLVTSADVVLGDESKSKYSINLVGSVEAPKDVDAVAIRKQFDIRQCEDDAGADMTPQAPKPSGHRVFNAFHRSVAQVELSKTQITRDVTRIGKMKIESQLVLARKREEVNFPAVVMEDYKDIGNGISIRITQLRMSANRELTVVLQYKRMQEGTDCPFFEQLATLDPDGKEIGGGRWTEGDPFGKLGQFTAKFPLSGTQVHRSFRLVVVTESETRPVEFEVKDMFKR